MNCVHLFIPSKNVLLSFEPGTGDNLIPEDVANGFDSYLNWYTKSMDSIDPEEDDGGMVLYNSETDHYDEDLLAAIPRVLDEAYDDPSMKFVLLAQPEDAGEADTTNMLTLSSGHITAETRAKLDEEVTNPFGELGLAVYRKGQYGWYVYLTDSEISIYGLMDALTASATEDPECPMAGWEKYPDLMRVMLFAMKRGMDILCFDGEGEVLKSLPFYSED